MCWPLIVDADCFGELKKPSGNELLNWLCRRHGRLSYPAGGRGAEELRKSRSATLLFEQLRQAGCAGRQGREALKKSEADVNTLKMRSNDRHMLALASVSEARLLVSRDQDLRRDFCGDVLPELVPHAHEESPVHREVFPIEEPAEAQREFLEERRCALLGGGGAVESPGS